MTRTRLRLALVAAVALGLAGASIALAGGANNRHDNATQLRANLIGFKEVPAVNTQGHATLKMSMTDTQIDFTLTYADLSGPPLAAHVHVGQRHVNGGVSFFFCGGGGKPPCPATTSGTVTGTVVAADVIGPTAQQFGPGDLAAVERAIRAGVTYANMHTAASPGGEIRGQVLVLDDNGKSRSSDDEDDDNGNNDH